MGKINEEKLALRAELEKTRTNFKDARRMVHEIEAALIEVYPEGMTYVSPVEAVHNVIEHYQNETNAAKKAAESAVDEAVSANKRLEQARKSHDRELRRARTDASAKIINAERRLEAVRSSWERRHRKLIVNLTEILESGRRGKPNYQLAVSKALGELKIAGASLFEPVEDNSTDV
jgi:chromosome segregation ATPase